MAPSAGAAADDTHSWWWHRRVRLFHLLVQVVAMGARSGLASSRHARFWRIIEATKMVRLDSGVRDSSSVLTNEAGERTLSANPSASNSCTLTVPVRRVSRFTLACSLGHLIEYQMFLMCNRLSAGNSGGSTSARKPCARLDCRYLASRQLQCTRDGRDCSCRSLRCPDVDCNGEFKRF